MGSSSTSKGTRCPTLSDMESRHEFIGMLRPENEGLQYTSHIRHLHLDNWSLSTDDLPIPCPGRQSEEGTIRRDVHWMVEQTYVNS
jgi:hypothetical protein